MATPDTLTAAQEAQLLVSRAEWEAIGRSTEPADRPTAEAAITALYAIAGKPKPLFFWVDGPAQGSLLISHVIRDDWETRTEADRQAILTARYPFPATIDTSEVRKHLSWGFWGQHEAYWAAYYDWPDRYVAKLYPDDLRHQLDQWVAIAKSCGWWHPYELAVVVCERPEIQTVDTEGRLHHDTGPAIRCRDGFEVYAWHGVRVPAKVITHPETITVAEITAETNQEIRRIMLTRFGHARYLRESGAVREQGDDTGDLYRATRTDDTDVVMVRVLNGSAEAIKTAEEVEGQDGTWVEAGWHKYYWLRVPPTVTSAREGVAWSYNVPVAEYENVLRT